MEKNLKYSSFKWIAFTFQSIMIGYILGLNFCSWTYDLFMQITGDVLTEVQYDALFDFYTSYKYTFANLFSFFAWVFIICLDYVVGQIRGGKKLA